MIIGKEPYFNSRLNDGLAYSTPRYYGQTFDSLPSVLQLILDEAARDMNEKLSKHGDLTKWAQQGVLLWNERPTSKEAQLNAHADLGWDLLTSEIAETVYLQNPNTVFLLWGPLTNVYKELLPSDAFVLDSKPMLLNSSFRGSGVFSETNRMLHSAKKGRIKWRIK